MTSATTCPSCGAILSLEAAFCEHCGTAVHRAKAAAGPKILTPAADDAVRQASQHAQRIAKTLGPEKIMALVGGFFGLLGALLPFYRVDIQAFIGPIDLARINMPSPSLAHAGLMGSFVILAAIALGIAPLITLRTRAVSLAGFGLATAVLGMVLGDFLRSSMFGRTFGDGFYYSLVGFALLSYVYARRAYESS